MELWSARAAEASITDFSTRAMAPGPAIFTIGSMPWVLTADRSSMRTATTTTSGAPRKADFAWISRAATTTLSPSRVTFMARVRARSRTAVTYTVPYWQILNETAPAAALSWLHVISTRRVKARIFRSSSSMTELTATNLTSPISVTPTTWISSIVSGYRRGSRLLGASEPDLALARIPPWSRACFSCLRAEPTSSSRDFSKTRSAWCGIGSRYRWERNS